MLDQHDRDRVGAREMLRLAGRAIALPAPLGESRRLPALGAEPVPRVPVEQAARPAVERQVVEPEVGQRSKGLAPGIGRVRIAAFGHGAEARLAAQQAEEHQFGALARLGQRGPLQAIALAQRDEAVELEQLRFRHRQRSETLGVGADVIGTVERVPGEREPHARPWAARSARIAAGNSSSRLYSNEGMYWVNSPARRPRLKSTKPSVPAAPAQP